LKYKTKLIICDIFANTHITVSSLKNRAFMFPFQVHVGCSITCSSLKNISNHPHFKIQFLSRRELFHEYKRPPLHKKIESGHIRQK
jgi:hypothetical protein